MGDRAEDVDVGAGRHQVRHRADEHDRRRREPRREPLDERDVDALVPRPGEHDARARQVAHQRAAPGAADCVRGDVAPVRDEDGVDVEGAAVGDQAAPRRR